MQNESMVYLNKIFSNIDTRSCPLLSDFAANGDTFTQQLSFYESESGCQCGNDCGSNCGCNNCNNLDFDGDLTFLVDHVQVFVNDFQLSSPESLTAASVTVNGVPVDALDYFNDRFMASTNALMAQVSDCRCMEKGASTKGMLLIQNAGSWLARLTMVLTGSVFGCGGHKRFKLIMTSAEDAPLAIPGTNTFAVNSICLPCVIGGIAPVINFSFDAAATLLNPTVTVDTGAGTCNVIVSGSLVTEPIAKVQVTRQTLFKTTASVVELPCDGMQEFPDIEDNVCCNDGFDKTADAENILCTPCEKQQPKRPQISCQWNGCNGCGF